MERLCLQRRKPWQSPKPPYFPDSADRRFGIRIFVAYERNSEDINLAGSQSFDQHLTELFQKQVIDVNEARRLASNADALNLALRGITNSDNRLR